MNASKKIHAPYNALKIFAKDKGITYKDIAKTLGITETTVSLKINGNSDFFLGEKRLLEQTFGMNNDLFL